ncbi:hypothetical protein IAQ61_004168 [Plenodomus lingam]|uniref:uncharacterized protein n=1 Tax=Leptosphaeria maculans TaxID=5022 RepID=UPI00332172FB|nr:hypothetical protein IAQ61_004168 [Plenodomus lingam]
MEGHRNVWNFLFCSALPVHLQHPGLLLLNQQAFAFYYLSAQDYKINTAASSHLCKLTESQVSFSHPRNISLFSPPVTLT